MNANVCYLRGMKLDDFFVVIGQESDRGCIVAAGQAMNSYLEDILRFILARNTHVKKEAVDPLFDALGPLASFSARIKLAYALGLLERKIYLDLNRVRKIRNISAHSIAGVNFEMPEIEAVIESFETDNSPDAFLVRSGTKLTRTKKNVRVKFKVFAQHPVIWSHDRFQFILIATKLCGYLAEVLDEISCKEPYKERTSSGA